MAQGNQGWKAVGCGCCVGVLLIGLLCAVALVAGTRRLVGFVIASEVQDYIRLVERADIDEGSRQELLDRLERLRARARGGDVGLFTWLDHEESLDELAEDGVLTEHEAGIFGRELDRLEQEIDPEPTPPPREPEPANSGPPLVRARQGQGTPGAAASSLAFLGSPGSFAG